MRESYIQKRVCEHAKALGWNVRPWRSMNNKGVPDRIFYRDGQLIFIEFKAPEKEPSALQKKEIRSLRRHGFEIHVIDNIENGMRVFDVYE